MILGGAGCGCLGAAATLVITPFLSMMIGWGTYEMNLHRIRGDDWAIVSAATTTLALAVAPLGCALIGAGFAWAFAPDPDQDSRTLG